MKKFLILILSFLLTNSFCFALNKENLKNYLRHKRYSPQRYEYNYDYYIDTFEYEYDCEMECFCIDWDCDCHNGYCECECLDWDCDCY